MLKTLMAKSSLIALVCSISFCAHAMADARQVNVPAGDLLTALQSLAKQSDVELVYQTEVLKGLHTQGVSGALSAQAAVKKLLEGTRLQLRTDESTGAMVISPPPASAPAKSSAPTGNTPASVPVAPLSGADSQPPVSDSKPSFWSRFRLAQADRGPTATSTAVQAASASPDSTGTVVVEEVLVTAQKRVERLQDVPVPVTAIEAQTLTDRNQLRLQDYYTHVPGMTLSTDSRGQPLIAIRGISTAATPTVGITVDDVPYGASTIIGVIAPDFDPSEISRIEVLRGPQGTLYGANSMGGLVKYVTVEPSMAGFSARVQASSNAVRNGDGLGYSLRGSVNVPLSDTWAVRASGSTRNDTGYIDDPALGLEGVNQRSAESGRVAALWRPSDDLSLQLSALLQHSDRDGSPYVHVRPTLADLQQLALPDTGWFDARTQAYSAALKARLGGIDLVSLSGYNIDSWSTSTDFSRNFGAPTTIPERVRTRKFTQEVRVSGQFSSRIEWLLGVFYADEKTARTQDSFRVDAVTGAPVSTLSLGTLPNTYEETAEFGTLTFHVTERFDIQAGVRGSQDKQRQDFLVTRPPPALNTSFPTLTISEDSFTYLLAPQFRISSDIMLYARLASGYRAGGANVNGPQFGLPPQYDPDKTQNYEIGLKGSVLQSRLSFDASVYWIDWDHIQVQLFNASAVQAYLTNAGAARSKGIELSLESRPVPGTTIAAWFSLNDAELTEAFPPTSLSFARPGDRLPFGSRVAGNLSLDQEFPLADGVTGFLGVLGSHVGERQGNFAGSALAVRRVFPAFTQVDLNAGARFGSWTANVFVNNVADRRGELATGQSNPIAFNYIQPRTVGMAVSRSF